MKVITAFRPCDRHLEVVPFAGDVEEFGEELVGRCRWCRAFVWEMAEAQLGPILRALRERYGAENITMFSDAQEN